MKVKRPSKLFRQRQKSSERVWIFQHLSEVMKNIPKLGQQLELSSSCPGHQKVCVKVNVTKAVPQITRLVTDSYSLNRQHGQTDFLVNSIYIWLVINRILVSSLYRMFFNQRQIWALTKISSFNLFTLFIRDYKLNNNSTFSLRKCLIQAASDLRLSQTPV